jgi:phosphoribosylformylglycinamidine cyclo-ligase
VPYLAVFDWLARTGNVGEREMLRTFNCGIGMICVTDAASATRVMSALRRAGETVVRLGEIVKRKAGEEQVHFTGALRPA